MAFAASLRKFRSAKKTKGLVGRAGNQPGP